MTELDQEEPVRNIRNFCLLNGVSSKRFSCQENRQRSFGSMRLGYLPQIMRCSKHKLHRIDEEMWYWTDEAFGEKSQGKLCRLTTGDSDVHYSKM